MPAKLKKKKATKPEFGLEVSKNPGRYEDLKIDAFSSLVAQGSDVADAYGAVIARPDSDWSDKTLRWRANKYAAKASDRIAFFRARFAAKIVEIQDRAMDDSIMGAEERMQVLTGIGRSWGDEVPGARTAAISAVNALNDMDGTGASAAAKISFAE